MTKIKFKSKKIENPWSSRMIGIIFGGLLVVSIAGGIFGNQTVIKEKNMEATIPSFTMVAVNMPVREKKETKKKLKKKSKNTKSKKIRKHQVSRGPKILHIKPHIVSSQPLQQQQVMTQQQPLVQQQPQQKISDPGTPMSNDYFIKN